MNAETPERQEARLAAGKADSANARDDYSLYFDWAASAPPDMDIWRESLNTAALYYANPSSVHERGASARECLSRARERCARALGVKPETLFFTSGGTESDYIPIVSLLQRPAKGTILVSAVEHAAVREQAEVMKSAGWTVKQIPADKNGIITPEAVSALLDDTVALVCVMAVNNETGAIQPVYEIADLLAKTCGGRKRPKFHVDAVQAAGKIPLILSHPHIDTAALSGHKIRAPRGTGLLYMANRQEPFLRGGGQESGIRSGTENLFGAWAISRCLEKYAILPGSEAEKRFTEAQARTARFISDVASLPGCRLIPEGRTPDDSRFSPWIVQASFERIPGEVMVRALSEKGISISTGSACSARKLSRPVLEAMKVSREQAAQAVRFSFGSSTKDEDIHRLTEALAEVTGRFSPGSGT